MVDGDGFVTPDGGEGVAAIGFDFLGEEAEFEFAAAFEGGAGFVEDGEVAFEFVVGEFAAAEFELLISLLFDFAFVAAHEFFEHEGFDGFLLEFLGGVVGAGEAEDGGFAGVDEVGDDEHGANERFAGADAAGDVEFEDGAGVGDALEGELVEK